MSFVQWNKNMFFLLNENIKLIFIKAYADMTSGMHDRLSENWFRENQIIFKKTFL